jgi:hypothetical protein
MGICGCAWGTALALGGTDVTSTAIQASKTVGKPAQPIRSQAQYVGKDRYAELTPLTAGQPIPGARDFRDLPLVLHEPVAVRVGDRVYAADMEGLYRFFDLDGRDMRQTYLYRGDVWLLAANLSQLHVHGWGNQGGLSIPEKEERARKGRLSITCGPTARFVVAQLEKLGLKGRVVDTLTLDDWNDHDCGHTLMELYDPAEQRWLFYDSDIGCRLRHQGRYLDLGEACRLYREGKTAELEFPAGRCMVDSHTDQVMPEERAFYSLLFDATFRTDAGLQAWYRRMLQVPVIGGVFPSDVESETARARAYVEGQYCRVRLSWADWRARFYGKSP